MATNLHPYDYANIFSAYTDENGYEFYNLSNAINISGDIDEGLVAYDTIYSFSDWYSLSFKHYGTTRLWWIILVANNISNPFDIIEGMRVKILKKEIVSEVLSQINNTK
jgi:hypothetical protein